jgi:hypothetical protein
MKKLIISALTLTVLQNSASAAPGSATGPTALALAAVIAQHSPAVRAFDKRVIARLFRGNTRFGFTPNTKISVDADSVVCRVSNVDITSRSCELTFGSRKRTLTGREANEVGNGGGCRRALRGRRRLEHRKHLQIALHDRSERDHAEGGRGRELHFRDGAVDLFARSRASVYPSSALAREVPSPRMKRLRMSGGSRTV